MTSPNESAELAAAVKQLRLLLREDVVLRSDIACVATVLAALASTQRDSARLDWLLSYITQYGLNGMSKLSWTVYDEDGHSLMHRKTISEDEVGEVRFDRTAIDAAMKATTP